MLKSNKVPAVTTSSVDRISEQHLQVAGELGFGNALALKIRGEELLNQAADHCEMDFSRVTRAGSAALTLLCSWLRHATNRQKTIEFTHLPDDLIGIARVSGIDQILPIK